jgi:RNA recognition motif-containing protein
MNIYVGNLSKEVTEDDLQGVFESFGQITSVKIVKNKFTDESRGFGFVEIHAKQEAKSAMENLNGTELKETTIVVNEARPRSDKGHSVRGRGSSGWYNRY